MSQPYLMIFAVAVVLLIMFIFMIIWAARFTKVGPNQVLVVSGRKTQRPDGSLVGYRIVKGGGTFVYPVVERVEVLSLEVIAVEMPGARAQAAGGQPLQADCVAQVKINSDDPPLAAAIERFLSKSQTEIAGIVRPVLEKHLSSVLANSSLEGVNQNPAAWAARVQAAAAGDLGKMGLSIVGFTIRKARAV